MTVIENAASAALALPSLTLMTMFEYVPTLALVGVPDSWPVARAEGRPRGPVLDVKPSVLPSASAAIGWKLYA